MTEEYALKGGYVLEPHTDGCIRTSVAANPSWPVAFNAIPNLPEFSSGEDVRGRGFIAKKSGWDMCVVPAEHRDFLLTLQAILDDQYDLGNATKKTFMVRPSRHTAALGEPHQSHMAGLHNHREEGPLATLYSASDILGTHFVVNAAATVMPRAKNAEEFQYNLTYCGASAAPPGMIVRFGPNELHGTPSPETEEERRRTFYVVVAYEEEIPAGRYGIKELSLLANPLEPYILPGKPDKQVIIDAWRENTKNYFIEFAANHRTTRQPDGTILTLFP